MRKRRSHQQLWRRLTTTMAMAIAAIGTIIATRVCSKDSSTIPHNLLSCSPLSFVSSFFSFYSEMLNMDGDLFFKPLYILRSFFPLANLPLFRLPSFSSSIFPFFFANTNHPQRLIFQSFRCWLLWTVILVVFLS